MNERKENFRLADRICEEQELGLTPIQILERILKSDQLVFSNERKAQVMEIFNENYVVCICCGDICYNHQMSFESENVCLSCEDY